MHQRDYILKYLEKLGNVIGVLLGLKKEGKTEEAIKAIDEALKDILGFDMDFLYKTPEENIIACLVAEKKTDLEQLNVLTELLYEQIILLELKKEKQLVSSLSTKLLKIYNYLEGKEKAFSFDRMGKIERIKSITLQG